MDESHSTIDRREALRRAALLLGGVLSAPTIAGVLADEPRAWGATPDALWKPRTLTPAQSELVATVAEHIIPTTDTPGARSAGVHRFVDVLLTDFYPAAERDRFLAGLDGLEARGRQRQGKAFVHCRAAEQHALLAELDAAAYPAPGTLAQQSVAEVPGVSEAVAAEIRSPWFWRRMKELTVTGYYTSQVGATRELRINPWGAYRDIPYSIVGRSWA